ncbi:MAG TPA: gluconate:H+ symporter, partial [Chitinophagaceae bacterium]|nr:gluconate:H+ symporter [Chitinophagaceae bacterium]
MQLVIIVLAVGLQIFLTSKKVSPFLSLLIVAILAGLSLGMQPDVLLKSVKIGVGSTLGEIALIICLGAILGKILELSGAAGQIANTLINSFGIKNIQWAVMLTGLLVGIPLFYSAGFIILVPLVFSIARTARLPLLYVAIPMAASLSVTHCFLPPHPGPMFLVGAFKADLGKTLMYGLVIAIPVVIIAGPLLGKFLKRMNIDIPVQEKIETGTKNLPGVFESFLLALLPVLLIALAVIANSFFHGESIPKKIILFIGDATVALLLSVLLAVFVLGIKRGRSMQGVMQWLNEAVAGVAVILLIITAGGVFKQVLVDSGTADYITSFSKQW